MDRQRALGWIACGLLLGLIAVIPAILVAALIATYTGVR